MPILQGEVECIFHFVSYNFVRELDANLPPARIDFDVPSLQRRGADQQMVPGQRVSVPLLEDVDEDSQVAEGVVFQLQGAAVVRTAGPRPRLLLQVVERCC